ncbi:hypothetical protein [Kocuria marina]|uniref:hypothetical protein n=1 Tax=Kocuria marina TaxID=223184 RepID=UPI0012EC6A67|nr:hypothetical protein [Kocuria marina]
MTALHEVERVVEEAAQAGMTVTRALVRRRIKGLRERGWSTEDAVARLIKDKDLLRAGNPAVGRRDPTGQEATLRADGVLVTPDSEVGFIPTQKFNAPTNL